MPKPRKIPKFAHGDGSLSWDATRQRYDLRHRVGGKLVHERATTIEACIAARDARRDAYTARLEHDLSDLTMGDLLGRWRRFHYAGKAPATRDGYDSCIAHIEAHLGDRPVAEIKVWHIEAMFSAIIAEGMAKATMAKLRSVLNMVFAYALRHGYTTRSPMASFVMPGGAASARKVEWLDETEMSAMRAHLRDTPSTLNHVLALMLLTGLRPGEALGLCWDAVDFDASVIHVRRELQRSMGGRVRTLVEDLKTEGSRRTVELPAEAVVALRAERRDQRARRVAAKTWGDEGLAFTTAAGRPHRFENLDRACKMACKLAGTKTIAPNGLRHTNASWLLHCGMTAEQVAKHLGHRNTRMVATTYGHAMVKVVSTAALFDAVER